MHDIGLEQICTCPQGAWQGSPCMTNPPGADLHLPVGCMAGIAMHDKSAGSGFALAYRVHGRDRHA